MKKKFSGVVGIVILAVALIVLGNSAFIIRENQYGLIREFGRIERVISDSCISKYRSFRKKILSQRNSCSMTSQSPMSSHRIKNR